jgi:hypothetical protein
MSASADDDAIADRADRLYAARAAMAETAPAARRIGLAELVRFIDEPGHGLSVEAQRALFSNAKLRADFQRLKAPRRWAELPAVAAASDRAIETRRFEGGTLRIHPSRIPGQVYVLIQFGSAGDPPRTLLLEGRDGRVMKRPVAAGSGGNATIILHRAKADDLAFLELMTDPTTAGEFLR